MEHRETVRAGVYEPWHMAFSLINHFMWLTIMSDFLVGYAEVM